MIGLFIILASMGAGLTITVVLVVGALIHSGVVTLPATGQRKVQQAKVKAKIAEFDAEAEEHKLRQTQLEFLQEAERVRMNALLDSVLEGRALEAMMQILPPQPPKKPSKPKGYSSTQYPDYNE